MTAPMCDASRPAPHRAGPARYRIVLPAGLPLINANGRLHHRRKAEYAAKLRAAAMEAVSECAPLMAAMVGLGDRPALERAHIFGVLHPDRNDRRDPANWYPSFKPCVDGLVDAGVIGDDDSTRVIGPDMRLGDVVRGGQLALIVRPLTVRQFAALNAQVAS